LDRQCVEILLFGAEAKAIGRDSAQVEVPVGSTCQTIKEHLAEAHASLRPFLKSARFAVNSEFAPLDQVIRQGDEVALIGMVSGG
jgi:molybdopterin converting factor small subunit